MKFDAEAAARDYVDLLESTGHPAAIYRMARAVLDAYPLRRSQDLKDLEVLGASVYCVERIASILLTEKVYEKGWANTVHVLSGPWPLPGPHTIDKRLREIENGTVSALGTRGFAAKVRHFVGCTRSDLISAALETAASQGIKLGGVCSVVDGVTYYRRRKI